MTTVAVGIVLFDSASDIEACLAALYGQRRAPDHIVVVDNASTDGGLEVARRAAPDALLHRETRNIGFAAGQNLAIALAPADVHVTLNPDCQLGKDFIGRTVDALERDAHAGSVAGRLLRFRDPVAAFQPLDEAPFDVLDSTGMIALRNRRVLDRGTEETADMRYVKDEYVFGVSGAAGVYRRAMLEDIAFEGQFFDESFFAYREDVDLAWRAQQRGWRCRYLPTALARHRRRVAPGRRRTLPSYINRLSLTNRWRMIVKNETGDGWAADWAEIVGRDVAALGYCALREQRTLLSVLDLVRDRTRLRAWRRAIAVGRQVPAAELLQWFGRRSALAAPELN